MNLKLTKFESEELEHKIWVLIDSGSEMWESIGVKEIELENLVEKIRSQNFELSEKEFKILKEEAENLLDIAETNLDAGFPEYKNDVLKLRKLMKKLDGE